MKATVTVMVNRGGYVDRPDLGPGSTYRSNTTYFVIATSLPDDGADYVARTPFFVGPNDYVRQVADPDQIDDPVTLEYELEFEQLLPEDDVPTQAFHLFRWGS
jgi:hypothetical protein